MRFVLAVFLIYTGCMKEPDRKDLTLKEPRYQQAIVYKVQEHIKDCSEYVVKVIGMRDTPGYQQQFRVVCGKIRVGQPEPGAANPDNTELAWSNVDTDWINVTPRTFRNNNIGSIVLAKNPTTGRPEKPSANVEKAESPYVGNPQYGQWKAGEGGQSFWEFYGKYRMLSDVMGLASQSFSRRDYDSYWEKKRYYPSYYTPETYAPKVETKTKGYNEDYDRNNRKYENRKPARKSNFFYRKGTKGTKKTTKSTPSKSKFKKIKKSKKGLSGYSKRKKKKKSKK